MGDLFRGNGTLLDTVAIDAYDERPCIGGENLRPSPGFEGDAGNGPSGEVSTLEADCVKGTSTSAVDIKWILVLFGFNMKPINEPFC